MKNEEKPAQADNHYPFQYVEEAVITYVFQTDTRVKYEVKFKHSPYIFSERFPFYEYVYEFALLLVSKPEGNPKIASDQLIPLTVVAIFIDFYQRFNNDNLTIYICDSSDFKQHVRKRKFDQWFTQYSQGFFVKVDEQIKDAYGTSILLQLL